MNRMDEWNEQPLPDELRGLMASYREALPDPEPSSNFMPQLWARIEARQTVTHSLVRLARGLVTAALASCLVMSVLLVAPLSSKSTGSVNSRSYIEVLAEDHPDEAVDVDI
jgi:hypothetical protein